MTELRLEQVTLRFGGLRALDDVSFTVTPGSLHALIGPNGAGKSSCFNVIGGLYRATGGTLTFDGTDLGALRPHQRAGLGIGRAFQNTALSATSTVLDNVMLGRHALTRGGFFSCALKLNARQERVQMARAAEICEFLGLGDVLNSGSVPCPMEWRTASTSPALSPSNPRCFSSTSRPPV